MLPADPEHETLHTAIEDLCRVDVKTLDLATIPRRRLDTVVEDPSASCSTSCDDEKRPRVDMPIRAHTRKIRGRTCLSVDLTGTSGVLNANDVAADDDADVLCLRLVVNRSGEWANGFNPHFLRALAARHPHLEELALDQVGMSTDSALPGSLDDWGHAFRQFKSLRLLALASLFVFDISGPPVYLYSDSSDSEPASDSESVTVRPTVRSHRRALSLGARSSATYAHNLCALDAWADAFLDEHLRMPPPFGQLWFLGVPGRRAGIGYKVKIATELEWGEEKEVTHYMISPAAAREGQWWWETD
ncbi:unnamed protein product [Peniophora sp. CBMAI 1063]|nr:unnamed protein product [Peniophora sp. CBMAI 1063]